MTSDQLKVLKLLATADSAWTKKQICLALGKNSLWFFSVVTPLINREQVQVRAGCYRLTEAGREFAGSG